MYTYILVYGDARLTSSTVGSGRAELLTEGCFCTYACSFAGHPCTSLAPHACEIALSGACSFHEASLRGLPQQSIWGHEKARSMIKLKVTEGPCKIDSSGTPHVKRPGSIRHEGLNT